MRYSKENSWMWEKIQMKIFFYWAQNVCFLNLLQVNWIISILKLKLHFQLFKRNDMIYLKCFGFEFCFWIGLLGLWSITRKKTFYATLNHLDLSFGYQTQMTFDEQTFVRHFPLVLRLIWNSLSVWIAKVGEKKHIV